MDVLAGLLLIGVGQGLFLLALLIVRPELRNRSNLFLAALVACLVITTFDDALLRLGTYRRHPWAAGFLLVVIPLIGTLLRLHVDALLTGNDWRLQRGDRGHILVSAAGALLAIATLAAPPATRLAILSDVDVSSMAAGPATFASVTMIYLTGLVQQGAAIRHCIGVTRRAKRADAAVTSRLPWLRGLLVIAGMCWLTYASSLVAGLIGTNLTVIGTIASLTYVVALYALGVLGLASPGALVPAPGEVVRSIVSAAGGSKYARSALDEDDINRLADKLQAAMERDRLYLDPALSLPRLARAVGASTNDVSQAINSAFGGNYYEFVSRYRIEEAKRRLDDPRRHETVLEILLAVGFNSKSVFNAAFKRETGITPSEYRDRRRT